ncbi:MAG: hypothetical protein IT192_04685 [Microbacteriaceae bacterium]|nr:hypothetical protein [Microbacteriaceae bacterium]
MARGKVARRNAIALVILAVLVVIAGYAGAAVLASGAQAQLDAANDRTQSLLKEQLKYSEVSQVKNLLAAAEAAKQVGMSTEVDWKTYLDNIQKSLPAGTLVTNVVAEVATPLTDFAQPTVPLQGNRIGELTFTATSPSLPDVEAWLRALSKLDGYVDASPGSIALDNTSKLYQVSIKMHIDTGALWLRFDDTAREAKDKALEEKRAQQEKEEAEKQTPSPSPSPSEDDADGGA